MILFLFVFVCRPFLVSTFQLMEPHVASNCKVVKPRNILNQKRVRKKENKEKGISIMNKDEF